MSRNLYPEAFKVAKHPKLYQAWQDMLMRCKVGNRYQARYADRGIVVCDEWHYWPAFAKWALANGWANGLEIDRRDNDLGYSPDNCRFVTDAVQTQNRDLKNAYANIKKAQTKKWAYPFQCVETKQVFQTQIEASRRTGVDRKSLRLALAGRFGQAGGFHWNYLTTNQEGAAVKAEVVQSHS